MPRIIRLAIVVLLAAAPFHAQTTTDPTLGPVLDKLGAYVASYAEKASLIVAIERYTQSVMFEGAATMSKPRQLVAEFAIVKASGGGGWVGYRDVVEVDGEKVTDRRDRLESVLTGEHADMNQASKIANESARYNIGPISRNFNVPTAALFFFQPANLERFTFIRKAEKKIDGTATWEIDFKETRKPTFIMTRAGKDVPLEGTLWVVPGDGTVVRTRLRLRNFADTVSSPTQTAPSQRPAVNPNTPTGGREALAQAASVQSLDLNPLETVADLEVTYKRDEKMALWLPSKMAELYEGPITLTGRRPSIGRSTTRATYSEFRQFGASARISIK